MATPSAYDMMKTGAYDPNVIEALNQYVTQPADTSKLPLPENIIGQGIQNTAEASKNGIMPAILSGLTTIANLANTSTGTRLASQALGGDVYSKAAQEQGAQRQIGVEGGIRALAAQGEQARKENLAKYGIEGMKAETEAARENAKLQFQAQEQARAFGQQANQQNRTITAEQARQEKQQLMETQNKIISDNKLTGDKATAIRATKSMDELNSAIVNPEHVLFGLHWGGNVKIPTQGQTGKPDNYGFAIGETRTGKDGKTYTYSGNDVWK